MRSWQVTPKSTDHTDGTEMENLGSYGNGSVTDTNILEENAMSPEDNMQDKENTAKDKKERKRRLINSSSNYVEHFKEADWSPLISSTADASFVMLMALCVTNGGFLALVLLGIRYWNKTENVITKEGSDGPDTNQTTPAAADELIKQLQESQIDIAPKNTVIGPKAITKETYYKKE